MDKGPQWAVIYWPHERRAPEDIPLLRVTRDCLPMARRKGFVVLADDSDVVDPATVRRPVDQDDGA